MSAFAVAVAGAALFLLSGLLAAVFPARVTAAVSVIAGGALTGGALANLFGAPSGDLALAWAVPGGTFRLALDPIAAVFLVPMGIVGALGAVYATRYRSDEDHPEDHRLVRGAYGVFVASMAGVVLAGNGVVFLLAWEVMALSAFLLVATDHQTAEVRDAAYIYLAATHAATLLLWVLFARIEAATGVFGFAPLPPGPGSALTVLVGFVGFGLKAGVMPFHVWLPGAHAAAPTHASALLSGVLLKVGVYGIVRTAGLMSHPPLALGQLVILLGAVSALGGVLFALGQHDVKRLLAYHSIENIGIILLGLGLALVGRNLGRPEWVVLGLAGAFLHVWNHAFFKGLLFLAAGAAVRATGTRVIDAMGGLARGMPRTATLFLVGALAISGLPPLNGFVSELMIYLGLIRTAQPGGSMFVAFATPVLAMVGALAVACFVKVYGAVFLGTARTAAAEEAREAPAAMLWPMGVLALACALIGLAPALVAPALDRAIGAFAPVGGGGQPLPVLASLVDMGRLTVMNWGLVFAILVVALLGRRTLRTAATARTWACGYPFPSPRIQYTASSFAAWLVGVFSPLLRPALIRPVVGEPFPPTSHMSTHVDDVVLEGVVRPGLATMGRQLTRMRVLQGGHVNLYIFIVLLCTVVLLVLTLPIQAGLRALFQG